MAVAAALVLACHNGRTGVAAPSPTPAPAPAPPAPAPIPAAPAQEVVPFDPALVRHWPGLPNLGSTCFINTAVKVLACLPELDGSLADQDMGDAPNARVRGSLRATLNWIRSGGARSGDRGPRGVALMHALKASMEAHPALRRHVTLKGGGHVGDLVDALLKVLGVPEPVRIGLVEKTPRQGVAVPFYYEDMPDFQLTATSNALVAAYDFTGVRDLEDLIRHVATHDTLTAVPLRRYPVVVPDSVFLKVAQADPGLPLRFKDEVRVPVFEVDRAAHTVAMLGEARLEARAVAFYGRRHDWAAIRGDDGWYVHDDEKPARAVAETELDDAMGVEGGTERRAALLLFRRADRP